MVPTGNEKRRFVRDKFASVASRYDLLNSLLSLKIDSYWRLITAKELKKRIKGPILDLCAGTLPLSSELAKRTKEMVIAVDFCYEMMRCGSLRLKGARPARRIAPVCGDGEGLPLKDAIFSGVTVAFGVRNLSQIDKGLKEMLRVLKPGGKLVMLEFSRPQGLFFSRIYNFYLHRLLPVLGSLISGDKEAYRYLADSIQTFYAPRDMADLMTRAGFININYRPLTFGIVTLYTGIKRSCNQKTD